MANNNLSPEEKLNKQRLDIHYSQTLICPVCHIRLPIDKKCGCCSLIHC